MIKYADIEGTNPAHYLRDYRAYPSNVWTAGRHEGKPSFVYVLKTSIRAGTIAIYDDRIDDLYVLPQFRRRGLATMLVDRAIEDAKSLGVPRLWVKPDDNASAKQFWAKRGVTDLTVIWYKGM